MTESHLVEGQRFAGDFRVLRPLGAGGMGAVYVVEQLSTGRSRALKLMLPRLARSARSRARFVQEAQIGARIASEHVVQVITAGIDEPTGLPYLVMELLDGEDLEGFVTRAGYLGPGALLHLFGQLCHALGAAHRAGIVHRDLKPPNVFLARSLRADGAVVAKLLDFGIAKLLDDEGGSHTTQAVGTPLWLAPEQAGSGQPVAPSTDVWALGLMAFWALTGGLYWRAAHRRGAGGGVVVELLMGEILAAALDDPRARAAELGLPGEVPDWFAPWFARAVVRDQSLRFHDADEALRALESAARAAGVAAAPIESSALRPALAELEGEATPREVSGSVTAPDTAPAGVATAPASPVKAGGVADAATVPGRRPREPGAPAAAAARDDTASASAPPVTGPLAAPVRAPAGSPAPVRAPPQGAGPAVRRVAALPSPRRSRRAGMCAALSVGLAALLIGGGLGALSLVDELEDDPATMPAPAGEGDPATAAASPGGAAGSAPAAAALQPQEEPTGVPGAAVATLVPAARPVPASMVTLAGGTLLDGSTAQEVASSLALCRAQSGPRACPVEDFQLERERRSLAVAPFSIDRTEVAFGSFSRWLRRQPALEVGERQVYGEPLRVVSSAGVALAVVASREGPDGAGLVERADGVELRPGFERRPAVLVTWTAAERFCRARGRALPTSAQWALAAGGGARRYVVSDAAPPCTDVVYGRDPDGPCPREPEGPAAVGSASGDVTPEGVHDLAGNVAEWVAGDVAREGPLGCGTPAGAPCRELRGGDWSGPLDRLRARARSLAPQDAMRDHVGFRCATPPL